VRCNWSSVDPVVTLRGTTSDRVVALPAGVDVAGLVRRLRAIGLACEEGGTPVPTGVLTGGLVVGVGEAAEAAEIFASHGGRPFRAVKSLEDVIETGGEPSLFAFVPAASLTIDRTMRLARSSCRASVRLGVMPVPPHADDWAFVVSRLLALEIANEKPATIAMYDDAQGDVAGKVLEHLRNGVDALVFRGHGNGCDLRMGSSVLCEQADELASTSRTALRCLPCHAGGHCLRERDDAAEFVGAASVRARVVLLLSCWSVLPADGLFEPVHGFATALFRGGSVAAVVGSVTLVDHVDDITRSCAEAWQGGMSLGDLTLALNDSLEDHPPSYLCVGDPEMTASTAAVVLPPETAVVPAAHERACAVSNVEGDDPIRGAQIAFLERVGATPAGSMCREVAAQMRADQDLSPYRGGRELCDALVRAFSAVPVQFPTSEREDLNGPGERAAYDHVCGAPLMVHRWRDDGRPARRVWWCVRCGLVADTPEEVGCPMIVRTSSTRVEVDLTRVPGMHWVGGGIVPVGLLRHAVHRPMWHPRGFERCAFWVDPNALGPGLRWFGVVAAGPTGFLTASSPIGLSP